MRNFFVKSTVETDPGKRVSVQEGTFDNTGIEDGAADLIVMAQVCYLYRQYLFMRSALGIADELWKGMSGVEDESPADQANSVRLSIGARMLYMKPRQRSSLGY